MLKFSKRKKGCLTWTLGILLFVMLAWGFYGIHIKQKAVQESKHPEVAQVVERYLRKVDSNALTDKGKIKNYKILIINRNTILIEDYAFILLSTKMKT